MENSLNNQCFRTALRILGRRDHSAAELTDKLKGRGFTLAVIETVIDECRRLNYLDDEKYAKNTAHTLRAKGFGPVRVGQTLRSKGIPESMINAVNEDLGTYEEQCTQCRRALVKKLKASTQRHDRPEVKNKLYRFLLSRGFAAEIVLQVLHKEFSPETE